MTASVQNSFIGTHCHKLVIQEKVKNSLKKANEATSNDAEVKHLI